MEGKLVVFKWQAMHFTDKERASWIMKGPPDEKLADNVINLNARRKS